MKDILVKFVSTELQLPLEGVKNTLQLLEEDATIPFISRYRKEKTGGLNEVQIESISDLYIKFTDIDKRKESILNSLTEQNLLTDELVQRIHAEKVQL